MNLARTINLAIRLVVAGILGVIAFRLASDMGPFGLFVAVLFGLVIFALFGIPFLQRMGGAVSRLFDPTDAQFRITPEYSVAEARAKVGRYQEAIDEYRKVIAEHPDDVYPHVRIADLAVTHLGDIKLGEVELLAAFAKAEGEDTVGLVANRLADLYQNNFQDPARALQVMEQLCAKLPGTNAAARADERIRTLREFVAGREQPQKPSKIAHRITDEETLRKRRGY
jgi:hypothetical protein